MAEPDNDPNAEQDPDLEADVHRPPVPQPPGNPINPTPPVNKRNLTVPKQTLRPDIPLRADANQATPHSPPTGGGTPEAMP